MTFDALVALLLTMQPAQPAAVPPPTALKQMARLPHGANAVTVSAAGRVFVNFPGAPNNGDADYPALAEVNKDGSYRPYPNAAWNDLKARGPGQAFVSINAIRFGPGGKLWVVDSGKSGIAPPRLIAIDTRTNRVSRIIPLAKGVVRGSFVDDVRFHAGKAILTDAGHGALIVVDLATGTMRRALDGSRFTKANRPMYADGRMMTLANGKPVEINADQLEISPDGKLVYFQAASGPMYTVPTADLEDRRLSQHALEAKVRPFADTPTTGGTAIDRAGNIYLADVNRHRIVRYTAAGKATTLVETPRLDWADAMWIDTAGNLWIPSTVQDAAGKHAILFTLPIHTSPE